MSLPAQAVQGHTVFIPIAVGDIITDESGKPRIIKVTGTAYSLAGLSLGSNKVEVQTCNARHQCGVGYLAGTVSRSSKVTDQHTDMLGTPVLETDASANVVSLSVYESFGKHRK
ncbi:hypothetical protein HQQ94_14810 [Shewanella sp. VB17]|uniref:hypothetical protein n=1 Tax=Shewanella sp. VB17 TaxID=2739432 RepID=UPI001567993F|nr:hypothetical protein [Shewanella sp. VB17]NRD74483.1 hypothetical protein [Shewanella sp. VB17]